MITKINYFFFNLFILLDLVSAQTTVPGGYVSGTWTASGSPFLVQGDIVIPADSALKIESGTEVNFQGHYGLSVEGTLLAQGSALDSVVFTAADSNTGWKGIRISESADSAYLEYCIIEHGFTTGTVYYEYGGGLYCASGSAVIKHCRISDNRSFTGGGMFVYVASGLTLSNCTFSNNQAENEAGGVGYSGPELILTDCIFKHNQCGGNGGGLSCRGFLVSKVEISDCKFLNNRAALGGGGAFISDVRNSEGVRIYNCEFTVDTCSEDGGGGISLTNSNVALISNCRFSGNRGALTGNYLDGGGAIYINSGISTISCCTVYNNFTSSGGGTVFCEGTDILVESCTFSRNWAYSSGVLRLDSDATIVNTIINENQGHAIDFESGTHSVRYCDFFFNGFLFYGQIPAGLGEITDINANGDSCDVYSNIFLDPLFEDISNSNCQITWANWPVSDSTRSPAIDAGDPVSPLDPDNTITDMGALYFNQLRPLIFASDSLLDFGIVNIGQVLEMPLTIRNNGTGILHLQNMANQHSVFSNNWNLPDSLILPGDSLTISITFTPLDTNVIVDTLLIENNNRPLQVQLLGKGRFVGGIEDESELPKVYALYPAYPNPFNPSTTIEFELPKTSKVILKIFNILGEEVATLVDDRLSAGSYTYKWSRPAGIASGIYLYRLQAGDPSKGAGQSYVETRKMVLMR